MLFVRNREDAWEIETQTQAHAVNIICGGRDERPLIHANAIRYMKLKNVATSFNVKTNSKKIIIALLQVAW